jgi:hypothetical protein
MVLEAGARKELSVRQLFAKNSIVGISMPTLSMPIESEAKVGSKYYE